ncbi:IDEAL domain-containing protein [Peribacillus asahii]|uniref:IDEAL domain-containing protein n=1 Tax=Peribacillus asahii TaxID=228899 RepID=A0A398BF10_9BACI|nr:IDEAL domain-containing protein [Peribacillus asahii]RID86186.1 IDEAL domain-containing protein [Peribacillus asahii]
MKNDKSYSELVKAHSTKKAKKNETMQEILIEMIIREAILKRKRNKLAQQIDNALDNKDKPLFLQLSTEMKELMKLFGN